MAPSNFAITIRPRSGSAWPVTVEQRLGGVLLPIRVQGELTLDLAELRALALDHGAYGRMLGEALFTGPVREAFVGALARVTPPLKVQIAVEDTELQAVAWERLQAPIEGAWHPLAHHQRVCTAHVASSAVSRAFVPTSRQTLRALVAAASPTELLRYNLAPFDVATAIANVRGALEAIPSTILAPLPNAQGPASLDAICRQLTLAPHHVLHLICHGTVRGEGDETVLYLCDHERPDRVDTVAGSALIARLGLLGDALPHLIFLSVCHSAHRAAAAASSGLAQRLAAEIGAPAVIAMAGPISVQTAGSLADSFYRRLLTHGEPDRALGEAAAGHAGRHDSLTPILFSRLEGASLFSAAPAIPPLPTGRPLDTGGLLKLLAHSFSQEELDLLCADVERNLASTGKALRVSLDLVGGVSRDGKVLNLVRYLERRGVLPALHAAVRRARPELFAGSTPTA